MGSACYVCCRICESVHGETLELIIGPTSHVTAIIIIIINGYACIA